jgi:hypothetical protein
VKTGQRKGIAQMKAGQHKHIQMKARQRNGIVHVKAGQRKGIAQMKAGQHKRLIQM